MNIRAEVYGYTPSAESPLVSVKNPKGAKADMLHSIPVLRREIRHGETRAELRTDAQAQASRIRHRGATHDVQLMNRCSGGAMIAAKFDVAPWDRVQLDLGGERPIEGVVLWAKNDFMGVQFAVAGR